jgi:polyphosphate kinase
VYQSEHFINRELSWLEFNHRVLEEARDKRNPIFEQMKFLAIVSSNLDEFFMVRVASLKDQVNAGYDKPDPAGLTPKQQLKRISQRAHQMTVDQYNTYNKSLMPRLRKSGFHILKAKELKKKQLTLPGRLLPTTGLPGAYPHGSGLFPPLSPDSQPQPEHCPAGTGNGSRQPTFATVQVPAMLPRLVELPVVQGGSEKEFMLLEDVIILFMEKLFTSHLILCAHPYRITRNGDLSIEEEEAKDLLMEIEKSIKRRRWGAAIRLEADANMDQGCWTFCRNPWKFTKGEIYLINGPLDLTFFMKAYDTPGFDPSKIPGFSNRWCRRTFREEGSMFDIIAEKTVFCMYPTTALTR